MSMYCCIPAAVAFNLLLIDLTRKDPAKAITDNTVDNTVIKSLGKIALRIKNVQTPKTQMIKYISEISFAYEYFFCCANRHCIINGLLCFS